MASYRIDFSPDWIKGRWGYIDRFFHNLRGRNTAPDSSADAWVINFPGDPQMLGKVLSHKLSLKQADFHQFGAIFEITLLSPDTNNTQSPIRSALKEKHYISHTHNNLS